MYLIQLTFVYDCSQVQSTPFAIIPVSVSTVVSSEHKPKLLCFWFSKEDHSVWHIVNENGITVEL